MKFHQIIMLSVIFTMVVAPWLDEKKDKWEKWKEEAWGVQK